MTFYEKEIHRLRPIIYPNQGHVDMVIDIRNYIDRNYQSKLSLDVLSDVHFVSKYHLLRLFKRYYGRTPGQYLIDKRIEKSKEHLKDGKSVTQACFAVGFDSLGSFSALFKRKTGESPSQYRKKQFSINDFKKIS